MSGLLGELVGKFLDRPESLQVGPKMKFTTQSF